MSTANSAQLIQHANLFAERHDFKHAIQYAEQAVKRGCNDLQLYLNLSQWYLLTANYSKVPNLIERLLDQYPEHPLLCERLSSAYLYLQDIERSLGYGLIAARQAYLVVKRLLTEFIKQFNSLKLEASLANYYAVIGLNTQANEILLKLNYWKSCFNQFHNNLHAVHFAKDTADNNRNFKLARSHAESRLSPLELYMKTLTKYRYWRGETLISKTIVILPEQGLGDELLYASAYYQLINQCQHCYILCDPRLTMLMQRSFPTATCIGIDRQDDSWQQQINQVDYIVLGLSLLYYFSENVQSHQSSQQWPRFKTKDTEHWQTYLNQLPAGKKIGIAWRSMRAYTTVNGRSEFYYTLDELSEVLKLKQLYFINLQYDKAEQELDQVYKQYKIKIQQPPLDLIQDAEQVMALMSCLDAVITPESSSHIMSAAVGCETLVLKPAKPNPPIPIYYEKNNGYSPMFKTVRYFAKQNHDQSWQQPIKALTKYIKQYYCE